MTWAESSLGQSLRNTRLFFSKQLWIWPIIAVLVLAFVGNIVRRSIESTIRDSLASELQTVLTMEVSMLKNWLDVQMTNADGIAREPGLRRAAYALFGTADSETPTSQVDTDRLRRQVAMELDAFLTQQDYAGFFLVDRKQRVIASTHEALVGQAELPGYERFLSRAINGESTVSTPMPSVTLMRDAAGKLRTGVPTMFVCVPIRDEGFHVVGALAFQMRPEQEFSRILQLGRLGESGETYAFNRDGVMVSNSRFDESLILLGLLPDREDSHSLLELALRDPGADITKGFRPKLRRGELPMTKMAALATTGRDGIDVVGYRDYRGVNVVGCWNWLPAFEFGIATEIDHAEAYRPLTILQRAFYLLYTLLVLKAIAIFAFTVMVARLRRDAQKSAIEAKQLGQYRLEHKIGEGAMGEVYRGFHAMMRRPTAIKLLHVERVTDAAIKRFEQEVQITCQLNHPNTIAIYDYGRTPEDVFYYAMEYLDGIDLQSLVTRYGPQPQGRVVQIMTQVCGSLYEAHSRGLVHRDIKPANIMLNRRGGVPDVVKVLDFGLVIDRDKVRDDELGLAGTPLYLSPEAIETPAQVDACSDLYAVGAVAYFMLVGKPVFEANQLLELLSKHVSEPVVPPSEILQSSVNPDLETAILACLEKSRAKRPQTARDLANMLRRCESSDDWGWEMADAWWSQHERNQRMRNPAAKSASASGATPTAGRSAQQRVNRAGLTVAFSHRAGATTIGVNVPGPLELTPNSSTASPDDLSNATSDSNQTSPAETATKPNTNLNQTIDL